MLRVKTTEGESLDFDPTISYRQVLEENYNQLKTFVINHSLSKATELIRQESGFESVTEEQVNSALYGTHDSSCYGIMPSLEASLKGNNPRRQAPPQNEVVHPHPEVHGIYMGHTPNNSFMRVKAVVVSPYYPREYPTTQMTTKIKNLVRHKLGFKQYLSLNISSFEVF